MSVVRESTVAFNPLEVGNVVVLRLEPDRRQRVIVNAMKLGPTVKFEVRLRDEEAHVAGGRVMTWHTRNELRRVVGA